MSTWTAEHVLGQLTIQELSFEIDLDGASLYLMDIKIATEHAAELIPGIVSAKLLAHLKIYRPLVKASRYVKAQLYGEWMLGGTRFDTTLSYPSFELYAQMGLGQTLNTATLTEKIFPGVKLPAIQLLDMDLYANFKEKSFEAEVSAGTDWEIKLTSDKSIALREIEFEVAYADGRVQEC